MLLDDFDRLFAGKLDHRAETFRKVIEAVQHLSRPTIVETGCLRVIGNWMGDGQSTIVLDWLATETGGTVWSVDKSAMAVQVARSEAGCNTIVVLGDSVEFLSRFHVKIDLLYLDSLDIGRDERASAMHCLAEFKAARPRLIPGSIVCIDDTFMSGGRLTGKGIFVDEKMTEIGAILIADGYQRAWRMP